MQICVVTDMKKSVVITKVALISAIAIIVLMFGGIFPNAALSLAALAGLFPMILVKEHGYSAAVSSYLVTGFLSLLLSSGKHAAALFILLFGFYQILKQWFESKLKPVLSYICKFIFANVMFLFLFFVFNKMFMAVVPSMLTSFAFTWAVYLIAFFIYDFAGSKWLKFYYTRIRQ